MSKKAKENLERAIFILYRIIYYIFGGCSSFPFKTRKTAPSSLVHTFGQLLTISNLREKQKQGLSFCPTCFYNSMIH